MGGLRRLASYRTLKRKKIPTAHPIFPLLLVNLRVAITNKRTEENVVKKRSEKKMFLTVRPVENLSIFVISKHSHCINEQTHKRKHPIWFSRFQVVSSRTNHNINIIY